ncbi:hypothetical protein NE651_14035 [Alistipes onderdonkii]|uniref:Uncharacterized protein n=1 Tax=Alistipes onderdonkii TaxID=328813 RepID=A0AAJ1FF03_9BACT|nr:hypothetical protein [Alistipes onderdonkii]MCQ5084002.1 hypothetical protein [Alistipes onderdonkii]
MKTCPVCGNRMEDSQHLCPDCGADYVEAVVNDIASGAGADSRLMLASLEEGLAGLDAVPLPALGDTARKMLPALCAAALVFCLLAGVATGANIFYLLAAVALVPLAVSLLARMQGKLRLSAGEVVVRAAARVFAEDAASVRERFAGDAEVLARLDAMQLRLDDALARQASAHAQNRRKVTVIAAVVLICCSAGAGALAVRNHAARKAQAAYAAQPEWVRLRDSYADAAGDDEYAGKDLRIAVVRAMLADGQGAAAEEPEAAPLVGDKNLINESTIIGKQEKYEASNITIHNNITEDHSHTTIVCAVSGKRIYLDHSVVCPKCGKQVALEYYVEASKRCENCEQQAREEYRAFVVRTTGAGPLDAACKQQLDAEAQRLRIDAATQASILRARQQKPAGKSAELTSVQRAELEAAVSRLITATEPEPAQKSLEALTVLHENSSNYEAGYWYFLARAVVCPEESVKAYEEELTDDYWQRFWGFLSYCNTGSPKGGAAVDRLRSVFGQREDDIRLAEAVYYLARGFDAFETSMLERAGELASSVRREYLSKPLISVYDTLQRLVRENIRLEEKYTPMETFVLVDVFRAGKYIEYLCVEQARKEQEAREAEARREQEAREAEAKLERERQTAEQALRRKQAEMSADRSKRMEQEMARLGGAKPAATQQADSKAFAGYETVVPGTKKRNWGKTILIVVVCLIALIGLLFLIPAPESLQ